MFRNALVLLLALSACDDDPARGNGGKSGPDDDGDGVTADLDCDDSDPFVFPGAQDTVGDGVDTNCDQVDGVDADGDNVPSLASGGTDCDDTDPTVTGEDADGDGFVSCEDCDDTNPDVRPGRVETCNAVDDDCDGSTDLDTDGVGLCITESGGGGLLDLLFVVDNSCSMAEEQTRLADDAQDLLDTLAAQGTEFHIGVTTTDLNADEGRLVELNGLRWIDELVAPADQTTWLETALFQGTSGSATEKGRDAAFGAIDVMDQPGRFNDGFTRADAHLAVLYISDEEDQSTQQTPAGFLTWFEGLKPDPAMTSSHAIVTPLGGCPDGVTPGEDYLTLATNTGGFVESLCAPSYTQILTDVGSLVSGVTSTFSIDEDVDPASLTAVITHSAGNTTAVGNADIAWDATNREATILDPTLVAGDSVVFYYALLSL